MYWASKGDVKTAVRILAYIDVTEERDARLADLVHVLLSSNDLASADYVASSISEDDVRDDALVITAFESARQGQYAVAITALAYVNNVGTREKALLETAMRAFLLQDYNSAALVASNIPGNSASSALMGFAYQVLRNDDPDQAVKFVSFMTDGMLKTSAIESISEYYTKMNDGRKAIDVLAFISDAQTRDDLAGALVNIAIRNGKHLTAIQFAQGIQDKTARTDALTYSAQSAASHGYFAEAMVALASIDASAAKDDLSRVLAHKAYAELSSSTLALSFASATGDDQRRNQLIYDLGFAAIANKNAGPVIRNAELQQVSVKIDGIRQPSTYVDITLAPESGVFLDGGRLDDAFKIASNLTDIALRDSLLEAITKEEFAANSYANSLLVLSSILDTGKRDQLLSTLAQLYTTARDKVSATQAAYMITDTKLRDAALIYIGSH